MNIKQLLAGIFMLICTVCFSEANAQEKVVTGTVTNTETKEPLEGVSITLKGTTKSVVTGSNGKYSISVPSTRSELIFTYVGFGSKEMKVGTSTALDVTLSSSASDMDEVVVIGYGTVKRKDLTGSVYSVKAADLVRMPTHNVLEAIQGRVPGVDLTRTSGAAGSGVNIAVRGNRTLPKDDGNLNGNGPLYIIDGFQGGSITDLNPNDIESMEILKDASATAIYGAQGANGVFIITTKKGASGKAKVNYDGFYGVNGYTAYPNLRTGQDYINFRREAYRTVGEWSSPADDVNIFTADEQDAIQRNEWVDWYDLVATNGQQQSHNVSVRGGNELTKAFLSAGYFREEGMLRNNDYNRYTVRMNVEQKLASWAKAGLNTQLTFINHNRRVDPMGMVMQTSPIAKAYDDNGNINIFPVYGNGTTLSPLTDERGDSIYRNNEFKTNILANGFVELNLMKGLTYKSTIGINLNSSRLGRYEAATSLAQRGIGNTLTRQDVGFGRSFNFDNILTYSKSFNDHNFTATAIQSYTQTDDEGLNAFGYKQLLASQGFYNLSATDQANRNITSNYIGSTNLAFGGRVNYDYKSKYILSLTYRADGASRLTAGKWDYFPSISAAWNVSDENFMTNVKAIDNLKLRASYGTTGNYTIKVYSTQSTLLNGTNLGFGEQSATYYYSGSYLGNQDLKWERSATTNIGVDFSLLNRRISGSIDVYNTQTTGVLFERELPRSSGSVGNSSLLKILQNIGETNNKGIEVSLNALVLKDRAFSWNSTVTFSANKEKIVKLISDQNILSGSDPETKSLLIGHPISSFYSYKKLGIWQTDEAAKAAATLFGTTPFKPGDLKVEDINGDNKIDPENDRKFLGSPVPKFVLGWQNNFAYKNFDLGIYAFVRYGQTINATFLTRYNPSATGNGPSEFNYWTPENPSNDFPRPTKGGQFINYNAYQSFTFVDGSFLKIKTVSLGYTLPKNALGKIAPEKVRFYVTANNCFTFSKNHLLRNYDPERGGDEGSPLSRQIVFGINLGL